MLKFYSIQRFRDAVSKLCSKRKEGYISVKNDIYSFFCGKSVDEIRINRDMVRDEKTFSIIKLRMPNSYQNLSKKDGYRLIYLVHKQREEVIFLYVYPKRGAQGLNTISAKDMITLLNDYVNEKQTSMLRLHQLDADLSLQI